jgi:DNA-binding response OmpR family regulator
MEKGSMVVQLHPVNPAHALLVKSKRVLLIDNDQRDLELLTKYCKEEGYEVLTARDGLRGLARFQTETPDFVLLNLVLPGLSGTEVCRRIRLESEVPVFFLGASNDEVDKLLGFEIGADDYITKPFSPREVMARMRLKFRRMEKLTGAAEFPFQTAGARGLPGTHLVVAGGLVIERYRRIVMYAGEIVPALTNKEYQLLLTLASAPGRVFSILELEEALYNCDDPIGSRAIGVHISNLRGKLPNPKLIETVYGAGYKWSQEQPADLLAKPKMQQTIHNTG